MFLKIEVATESLSTARASEWLAFVVRMHVEGEVVDLVEGLVADGTPELLLLRVRQLMVLVVSLLVESLAALFAGEGFETVVDSQVSVERRRSIEGLSTRLALMWLLRCVDDLVSTEGTRLPESFIADLTDERTSPRMHRHVSRQIVVRVERFSTLRTDERLRNFNCVG